MLTAKRYICAVGAGVTKPAFFEANDGNIYVVKLARRNVDYPWLISEQLAANIGIYMRLPFPPASLIYIDNDAFGVKLPTTIHFASRYLQKTNYLDWQHLPQITNLKDIAGLILFDEFFFNDDRIKRNRNLLLMQDGSAQKIIGIDHSHLFGSLHWSEHELVSLSTVVPDYDLSLWQALLSNHDITADLEIYSRRLFEIASIHQKTIIEKIPDVWLNGNKKIRILLANFLTQRAAILPVLTQYISAKLQNQAVRP